MTDTLFVKQYDAPKLNIDEILRYAGCKDNDAGVVSQVNECLAECKGTFACNYKVCYRYLKAQVTGSRIKLGDLSFDSEDLSKNLQCCDEAVVFAATVGIGIDRLIAKYSRISPFKAVIFQAIGAERIESLCDQFNTDIKKEAERLGKFVRPRFSPGYGDFRLENQRDIFALLDCQRKIGLTLNESLLMSPSKSVTAVIGIGATGEIQDEKNKCENCKNLSCAFRR